MELLIWLRYWHESDAEVLWYVSWGLGLSRLDPMIHTQGTLLYLMIADCWTCG